MEIKETILTYLLSHGKKDKYKTARELRLDVAQVVRAFDQLSQEGAVEIKEGKAVPLRGKAPTVKVRKEEKQPVAAKEEIQKEELVEASKEKLVEEQPKKASEQKSEEIKEDRLEGSVKFFNPNKNFGFITGDDGKEYYVHESSLKEGVTIEADDRVSFKVVQDPKGPKAEEVENLTQSGEQFRRTYQEHDQNVA